MRKRLFALGQVCALAATLGAWNASAETRYVAAGQDLQAALDTAQPGDMVVLQAGATFVGNFVLPVKSGTAYITVRTESAGFPLPGPGERISPSHAPGLAKLRSPNSISVLQTAPGAHHWRFQLVEFQPNNDGYGDIVRLGDGNQTSLGDVPYELEFDRVYLHGDPLVGQKRGISLQSASTRIVNSYIADIKAVGMDTQAICGWNGPGPYLIENNYLEGAGENVMFGGADPAIVGLVPSDITFRLNHVRKPIEWRQPLVATPAGTAASMLASGALPAGSYTYRVAARRPGGQGTMAISAASPDLPITASTGGVRVTWSAVPGATEYRVYRLTGTAWQFWTVTSTAFDDTGAAGAAGTPPTSGTLWSVKNLFEVKNARRLLLEGNVFEYNWLASQTGYAILLKSWNEGGNAPWSTAQDITFTHNIVRHVASAFNILGYSYMHPSTPARNISITHNLVYDVDASIYGGDGRFVMVGAEPENVTVDHNTVVHTGSVVQVGGTAAMGFRYTNNLTRHNAYGFKGDGTAVGNGTIATYFPDGVVTRSVLAGGNSAAYPPGNEFPSVDAFYGEFVDENYHLRADSPYRSAGTDGMDLGADVDTVLALTAAALSGSSSPPSNQPPTAAAGGPYSGPTLQSIVVSGGASSDPDGSIVSYVWNWGDGCPTSEGIGSSHEYARPGTYTATLTVTDDAGGRASDTTAVTVLNRIPVASAGGPYAAEAGASMTATAAGSVDPDGAIVSYLWTWGDGTPDTSAASPTASHAYANPGTYSLTVTVSDDNGAAASASTTAAISAVPPPPPDPEPSGSDVVIYAAELPASALHGNWVRAADASAASGATLASADLGWSTTSAPLADPAHYFEAAFEADAGVEYRVWLRLRAAANSKWNDAVWVQFSDAVDAAGTPLHRIGTTGGLLVNLATTSEATSLNGWGWQNGAYWLQQADAVRFPSDGVHTLRVQIREDGVEVDQIVLSPERYLTDPPGPAGGDATIVTKPATDIVMYAGDVTRINGWWQRVADASAAGGFRMNTADRRWAALEAPLASPSHYFEVTVPAQANVPYRVWLRMRAARDSKWNDGVWVQFSGAVNGVAPLYRIGTASGLLVNLATTANGSSLNGWGWQDGAYWLSESQQPSVVTFDTTGPQTIRVQLREDGVSIDQIVLSPERYLTASPGKVGGDTTIVQKP